MQVFEKFAEDLRAHGYNIILQPNLEIRPLDLIASQSCRHLLLGPIGTLVHESSPTPSISSGLLLATPSSAQNWVDLQPLQTGPLSLAAGRALLERLVLTAGGILPDLEEISDAQRIAIEYIDLNPYSVEPDGIRQFLRNGTTRSTNSVFREVVFSATTLYVVASVLQVRNVKISFQYSSGKGATIDYEFLKSTLPPDILVVFNRRNEITIEVSETISVAAQLLPLVVKQAAFDLDPGPISGFFKVFVFYDAILPVLHTQDTTQEVWPILVNDTVARQSLPLAFQELAGLHEPFQEYVILPDRGVRLNPEESSRATELFSQMHNQVREGAIYYSGTSGSAFVGVGLNLALGTKTGQDAS